MRADSSYYDAISLGYDDLYGEEQRAKISSLRNEFQGRVLDAGCGTSILASELRAEIVVGLDISKKMIEEGRSADVVYVVGDAEMLPFKDQCFDLCISTTLVQDLDNPSKALKEMCRVAPESVVSLPQRSRVDIFSAASSAGTLVKGGFVSGKDNFYVIKSNVT